MLVPENLAATSDIQIWVVCDASRLWRPPACAAVKGHAWVHDSAAAGVCDDVPGLC